MTKIKFGTDGWRAIIARDFTVDNLIRVTEATAKWITSKHKDPIMVVGHDCRFAGSLFAETVSKVLGSKGIKVFLAKGFVSTPMVSLGTLKHKAHLGIIITASHNPPDYNGFKLKGAYGGPLLPASIEEIENLIQPTPQTDIDNISLEELEQKGLLVYTDLEKMYCDHVESNFDMKAIQNSGLKFAYDAMYGAGQNVIQRLFPAVTTLHCEQNPSFMGQAPEPIHKNLQEFSAMIKRSGNIASGLATDGDADRIGLYDEEGNFVDSHHIILLLIHYLVKYKNIKGKVCVTFSTSSKIRNMCKHYGLEMQVVKIGFKYICEIMEKEDVLIGGEESGGIAIKGHIPERDGIWMGLVIWEFMAKSGKSLKELIKEVYDITGPFAFERSDLHLDEKLKNKIMDACKNKQYESFGNYSVKKTEDIDGYKFFFNDDEWLMIRASGTEPVLRTYAESRSSKEAFSILKAAEKTLLS